MMIGATPRNGSSSSRSFGPRHQRAADRHHLLLAARELAGRLARLFLQHGKQRVAALDRLGRRRRACCGHRRPSPDFRAPSFPETAAGLPAPARCRPRHCRRCRGRRSSLAAIEDRAAGRADRGRCSAPSVVDLPAPLAPSSATRSPSRDAEAHVPQRAQLAVIDGEMRDLEHHAGSLRARRRNRSAARARPAARLCGAPSAMIEPCSSTTSRSTTWVRAEMMCSTQITVMP